MARVNVAQDPQPDVVRETLTVLLDYFGQLSADEADSFQLGYYAGAIAVAVCDSSKGLSCGELAARVDAEFRRITDAERHGVSIRLSDLRSPFDLAERARKRKHKKG